MTTVCGQVCTASKIALRKRRFHISHGFETSPLGRMCQIPFKEGLSLALPPSLSDSPNMLCLESEGGNALESDTLEAQE